MARYTALIDGQAGAYGVVIPDLPGCTAMGKSIEEAIANAAEAMRDWADTIIDMGEAIPAPRPLEALRMDNDVMAHIREGATLASIPLVRETGRPAKANLSIDEGILRAIDAEAKRQNLTRSAYIELMAKRQIPLTA
ncbi:type II toxin-antitoxin system HicB family antitoxin [Microvirga solisilvae]|uniref:type II toxin-antitoxin system HicB family antitoxin n=1 Tax=Microvirga solisilvae TaxID=2919498 RepID=UPI001FAEC240|nr:type II toxin-antitoxin system HicB family antitoxin [Microvirga solisilvae]